MAMRFRQKLETVDAFQLTRATWDDRPSWPTWFSQWIRQGRRMRFDEGPRWQDPLEGPMRAEPGDWIVRHGNGEMEVLSPEGFARRYDPVAP